VLCVVKYGHKVKLLHMFAQLILSLIVVVLYSICVESNYSCCSLISPRGSVKLHLFYICHLVDAFIRAAFHFHVCIFFTSNPLQPGSSTRPYQHVVKMSEDLHPGPCFHFQCEKFPFRLETSSDCERSRQTGHSTGGSEMERETESPQRQL